ncbi:MAG: exosortase E/protease, VPEID-CTERM system [Planctomycetes bacterium]|nr:exosortase E/protease, VPEID-CTERM system [Planctomycetota bacterium]
MAGALLLAELLLLLGSFTGIPLADSPDPWLRLMARANVAPQILLAVATALLLFGPQHAAHPAPSASSAPRSKARIAGLLAAQVASFAVLFRLSTRVFDEELAGAERPGLVLLAWAAAAAATSVFAALLCQPLPSLLAWLRRSAGFLIGAVILGVVAWLAGKYVADDLREPLRGPTLWLAVRCLALFVPETYASDAEFVFGTPEFQVRVAPQCSGFEGIGLAIVFLVAYLAVFRQQLRFPMALLLPVIGVSIVWLVNVLRLAGLALLGSHGHADLAAGGFHSVAGTLSFSAVALGLVAVSRRMHCFWRGEDAPLAADEAAHGDATAAYLTPFLLAVAAGMVTQAFQESAPLLEPVRTSLAALALLYFWREYELQKDRRLGAAIVLGLAAALAWVALPSPGSAELADEVAWVREGVWGRLSFIVRLVGYVVVFPLAEELAFRGYLLRRLTSMNWRQVAPGSVSIVAWIVSTLIFGLLHEHWIGATIAGALYGLVFVRTGSLTAAVVAHGVTNAALAAYDLGLGALRSA